MNDSELLEKIFQELSEIKLILDRNRITFTPNPPPPAFPPNPLRTLCPKCNIDLSVSTHYVCNDPFCPVGGGPTMCKSETGGPIE